MGTVWAVIWFKDRKKLRKTGFKGKLPRESGAIDYAKKLKSDGINDVYVVCASRGFAPPPTKLRPPEAGMMWCPYCLAWREFVYRAITRDGHTGPHLWRCPICTISTHDFYVRRYNNIMVAVLDVRAQSKVPTEKAIRRNLRGG